MSRLFPSILLSLLSSLTPLAPNRYLSSSTDGIVTDTSSVMFTLSVSQEISLLVLTPRNSATRASSTTSLTARISVSDAGEPHDVDVLWRFKEVGKSEDSTGQYVQLYKAKKGEGKDFGSALVRVLLSIEVLPDLLV